MKLEFQKTKIFYDPTVLENSEKLPFPQLAITGAHPNFGSKELPFKYDPNESPGQVCAKFRLPCSKDKKVLLLHYFQILGKVSVSTVLFRFPRFQIFPPS